MLEINTIWVNDWECAIIFMEEGRYPPYTDESDTRLRVITSCTKIRDLE